MKKIKWRVVKTSFDWFVIVDLNEHPYMRDGYVFASPYHAEAQEIADKLNEEEK